MRWQNPELLPDGAVKIPSNWLFNHYYEAVTVLFRIENALRTFVFVILKDTEKSKWQELAIKTEDGADTTIAAVAKKRLAQDQTFGYLGYPISSPLMHLTSGELIRIILSDAYWPRFSSHFPASKSIVQTKLEEIGNVRNALAHFRPLNADDVQVVKQNANQVLSGVETLLVSIVDCSDTVPTNSKDAWYDSLKVLSGPYVKLGFSQSIDEKWVRLEVEYSCQLISEPYTTNTYRNYRVLSVNTPRMLRTSKVILQNVIFASEYIPYVQMPANGVPAFSKTVRFLFSRKTLGEKHDNIKKEVEDVLKQITTETDLTKDDSLARGDVVQSTYVTATREAEDKAWRVDTTTLHSRGSEDDPPEYWADYPVFGANFVSHSYSFPWMPVTISQFSFPF
jgi:hypothetical protein